MSRLSDAIDANRNRAAGQTGGSTGLQKAGRPTGTQGTSSTKTTQTSSRVGGGSVLSQAIDRARSGETVERATGVQLPQSFRGLTDTQRSGVSITPSASSLFQNRFNRDSGGSRTATTTQRRTTAGGFYSMPDFGAESQRLESAARTAQSAMNAKKTELEGAYSAMTELEKSAQFYGQQAKSIYETYLQNQDPTWGSLFERASANYERANQEYSAAADTFNSLYSEYEPLLNSYNQAAEAYNQYVGSQQEQYSAWRSTIRSQDAIQQDIAATDAAIQELTSQRNNLNRQKSNANRYRGIGLEEGTDEKIKSLDAQVEDLEATKTLLQEELEWSQYFRYADLTQAEDFAELSQYRSTANGQEPEFNAWSGMYTETGFDDINYDIINRNEEAMGHQMVNDIQTNASFLGLDNSERKQMTDEEIAIFNYLYAQDTARGDTEHSTAYGYIDYLTGDLNYRQRQADEQAWAEYARESPVASSVFSVITSPLKGLSYLGQAADYLEDREIDQNAGYNKFSYMNSAIRDEVTGIVEDKWGGVGSFAYNTGMSMADFLFNTAVSGGNQAVALAIMGTGAAADTTIDAKDRGLSDDQAFALGTIAGAAEIITEKVSLDRLFNADWEKGALKYILGNAFTEGSEEVASDTINLFADILIAKDKSEWQTSIDAYMEQGMTREEAMGKAVADQAAQMGLDFLGGAISGGVMSGGASVGNAVSTYNTGRALNRMNLEEGDLQAIIQEGLASDPSTRSYQEAVRLQQQMEQGKTPGTYQLGSLYRANIRAIDAEQQGAELLQRARQELDERGSVRNGTARSILENVNAVNTLTAQAGLNLTDSMNQRQRREAVKQAINNFSTSTETDVETGSDTGVQQTEGVVLPTAEDLENQNQQAAEVQTDAAVDTTTEPGMLPTAEQLEVQQRLERASTDLERSGIQAGAREENIQTVQRLSDILGRNIRFYDGRTREAGDPSGAANGYYDLDEDTIYVNSRSRNPVAQIVSHELTHSVETADAYADLSELVLNRIQQTGGNLEQLRREKAELYARRGARLPSQKAIDQEIVANYVERYLLTDEQSIRELTQQNRSLGQRILSWLNQLLAKLGNASAQERAFLTQARDTYARALQQTQTSFNQQTQQAAPAAGQSTQQTTGPPIMEGGGTPQVQEQQTRPAEETRRAEPEAAQEAQEGRRRQPVSEPDPEAQRRRSEAQDALEGLREDYAAGRITEEEFDAALDAIMEEEGLAGEEMLEQYSIDENYERDIDEWDAQGRPDGEVFILGSTGDVLQGLGAMEQDIYLRSEKVNTILQQHPEMTLAEIKRIPEILDDPVLVLKSRNVGRGGQQNTRLVLFGTVRAENGQPVLAVLDLRPVENGLAIDDMQKVTSSYTKDSNPVWYVQNSDILHADKNRTIPLLRTIGFQMPIELQRSGSMGSISYNRQNVNIQGVPFDQVVDTTQQQEDGGGWRYSFGGRNANAADLDALNHAQEMERQGVAMDTIFRETGWYTGADGKWRFEIDDSGMEYSRWGDLRREDRAEYARFRELEGKFIDGSITMDEQNELRQLLEEGHGAGRAEEQQTLRLPDFVRHDELYQNYPQLRQAGLRFTRLPEGTRGTFDGQDIVLDESLRSAPEDTLVHEIQHAIQRAEGFTGGASPEGWQAVRQQVIDTVAGARQNLDLWLQDIGYPEYVRESMNRVVSGEITLDEHWKALEEFKKDSPFAAEIARCEEELANYENQLRMLNNLGDGEWGNSFDMYENTAGEIEARDVTARRQMTPEQRRETMPNTGDERTVFAETMQELGSEYGMWDALPEKRQFSMSEPVEQTRDLLALHNLTEDKLRSTLRLGGFPMPSIAVIRDQMQHDNYGEITMVFGKDTIDPQADSRNRVYGGDAWTPTAPRVDYGINQVIEAVRSTNEAHSSNSWEEADIIGSVLIDAARGRHTPAAVQRAFRKEDYTISRELAQQIVDLFNQAANVPTGYFEAKPQRAVPLDEILAAVVPDTVDAELRSELEGAGVPTITYPEGDTQRRMEAVNSVEGAKFSISEEEDAAPERRDTQEDERVFITPRGVEVVRNPTDQEYQQMRDEAYQDYPWLWGTGEPVLRHTYDRQGNEYYWRADQAVHAQVEPYINQRYGTQTSQQWQWWTREDADEWPTDYGRQYSVEEEAQLPTAAEEESRDIIGTMPVKAQQYLRRAESYLTAKVGNLLSVPRYAQREYLRDIVREISLEYLREGRVSGETINELFDRAYDEGVVVDREFYDQYEELRNYLRTVKLTISPEDSADIADFNDFRKSNFGRLNISTQGGTNIDRVYQELESMWPEFFSEERQSNPSDQLQHIADVAQSFQVVERNLDEYYGPEAAEFRRWARHDFEAAVNDALSELNRVRRYVQERETQATTAAAPPTTQEEVTQMWGQLKQARRTYEKTAARNLLTQHDQVQVGRLLRGEIELEHLNERTDNVKGIREVYQAKLEYERLTRLIRQWNQSRKAALRQQADRYLQTANDWKDKRAGILYSRETMERNIRDIVKDATLAEEINQTYFAPVHDAAAAANRMKNQYRDRARALNLSRNVAKGNTVSEAHAVQLLGEAEDNIRILEQSRGRLKERDGKSLEDWRGIVNDLWEENPNLDAEKIRAAVAQFRTIYDELFQQMNEVRVRNGYEPVNYRNGYFPHFQPGNGDGILAQFGKALGIDTEVTALPTTINGLTHTFRPGIRWFGNAQERLGFNTAYDAVEGFDRYIEGVADVIHQTDNIQRLRALASQARYRTGDEGIRKQVDEVRANPNLTEEDKQNRIEKIYETGRFALSNFVVELEEYTNLLANKKSRADRNMEQALGRNMYNLVKALEGRVAANMVAVNPASWLTNFIPLTQGGALLDRGMLLKGMWDTLKAYKVDDGIVDKSSFLTNRRGSDPLVRTWAQKASATASRPMEYIDHFVADSLVRARYRQNLGKNMSEDAAMSEADAWVAGVMADRSKGSTPTLFNRSNPITKVFTQFQLEVNNQLSYLFKDMPKDVKDKGIAALAAALLKFFLGAWLFDEVYEYVIGRRPALDPIGILNDTVGDLTGYELPNLVELGVGAVSGNLPSFEVEQTGISEAGANLAGTVAETLPFIGGVLGGGRVPISSAIPNLGNLWNALTNEDWSAEKRLQEVRDELLEKPLVYLALPFGGGQLKKIYEGIEGVIQGGSYSVNAEGEQELQYPIYNDTPAQAVGNAVLASTFGRTSLPTGRDWIEGGFDTLGAKQTAVYQGLLEAGVPGEEAYALLEQLRGVEKTETESEAAQERRLLQEADISGDGKSIVYYGLMASDRERELMDELADMDADMGEVTTALLGIKDAGALKGAAASNAKRDAIAGAALSEDEQIRLYNYTFGEKQDDGSYVSSRAEDIAAFQEAGLTFDQFLEAQNEYSTINEEFDSSGEKAVEFARWVNGQGLTEEQAAVVKDAFTYYSQIPQSGGYYEKFAAAGLDDQSAYDLNEALDSLEPPEGEDQVTSLQKYQAVVNSDLTESEQMTAMGELMPETEYEKLRVGSLQGVTPRAYVSYKQALPLYDADGNGSFKQEEVRAALDSLPLTTEQRAALWQMQNKSWKPSSNPYSVSVSQQVYDALNAEDEDDGGLMDWSGGITLPTAEELEQNGLMNWN